ncbi:hypothetical protein PHET_04001 [Paragonimus heterotremus]|uniref:Uncharacterized protein n=1 Tax=Paragonimus heterotremus TaxID=100268 RepID=A0A8J4TGD3_9TREM|nr:hypothetical protein PHET_04001 [Paragonimus heterotremus]
MDLSCLLPGRRWSSTLLATLFFSLLTWLLLVGSQQTQGYQLQPLTSYMILAPNRIRPNEMVRVAVSIFRLLYRQLTVRISVKINTDEIISDVEIFQSPGTRLMQLEIPDYSRNATYWFHVEGSIVANSSILFFNRTKLEFMPQSESLIIQVSKPVYHQSQIVRFRVIPVRPDLTPSYGSLVSIEVLDASQNVFRRWLNPMTNTGGIIELDFPLSDIVQEGEWTIRAQQEQFSGSKKFRVVEYCVSKVVHVSQVIERSVSSDAFFRLYSQLDGLGDFVVTLDELRRAITGTGVSTSLANTEVWINVTFNSWWEKGSRKGWTYTQIFSSTPMIRFLGGQVRPFKPNLYFTAYLVVFMPDGSMVKYTGNRRVRLQFFCNENTLSSPAVNLAVPDSGLITYTYRPSGDGCVTYRLQADYMDETDRILSTTNQRIFRYHSYSNTYLQLSTSTLQPRVNEFLVVTVQTNYPTDRIHFVVISNGNILAADQLRMPNAVTSRTFSVAVSRAMFPVAHLVAYFIKDHSEIVSDALTFYTNYTNLNNVQMVVNRGKDLNQDTVEIKGYATPGAYLAFNVIHADLYKFAGVSFLREFNIVDELLTYGGNSQQPFMHTWYENMVDIQRVYVPAPSYGADANTTMNVSGLILFTDANFTKANFYHTCNETLDPARALPCFSMTGRDCYSRAEQCNGIAECVTWVDEMNCPINETDKPQPLRPIESYQLIYRLWNDGAWLWHSSFVKPDGQIQFRVNLPKLNADWIAGAFSMDTDLGLALMQQPHYFSGLRRFYMTVEVVEEAVWGEQLGVRVCLFNNWDYWIEALVEVKASPDVRIVQVGEGGRVSAYGPAVALNESVQSLAFLQAGTSRYIYMPVLPKEPGNTSFTICAYSFVGSNCETRMVNVRMNGVPNYYHTATFVDLTSSSALFVNNFKVIVPQKYTIPERRLHRFVPGSQYAKLGVVGDFVGPALSSDYSFATIQDVLRMRYGSAESVFFELGYNLNLLLYLYGAPNLPDSVLRDDLLYCTVVLQRGFAFFNSTVGGFANFRDDLHKPDPLPTAFALWNLLLTRQPQWNRLIFVDDMTLITIINYLANTQQISSNVAGPNNVDVRLAGSWDVKEVLDRRFAPISNATDPIIREAHRRLPCAAMIVIALRSTGRSLPSGIGSERAEILVSAAVQFISRHILQSNDLFSIMIGTYALSVATDATSQQKIMQPIGRTVDDVKRSARKIALISSVDDSLVALHALCKFALADTNRRLYRMAVDQKISSISNWFNRVYISDQNYSTMTVSTFPPFDVWGDVTMKTEGTGRLSLQMDVRVNVEYPSLQKMPRNPQNTQEVMRSFEIECVPGFAGRNNSIMLMKACGRWVGTTITPNETCIQFRAERYYPVANMTQQHICSAYEYYEPGRYNHSLYNVISLYTNSICNVCGSFACPYCPDYNGVKRTIIGFRRTSLSTWTLVVLWLMYWCP